MESRVVSIIENLISYLFISFIPSLESKMSLSINLENINLEFINLEIIKLEYIFE